MNKNKGFSLIELMMVVALIGIIAAIAIPNYQEGIKKSRRADAKASLLSFAAAMEREYSINGTYLGADEDDNDIPDSDVFPSEIPIEGNTKFYDMSLVTATLSYTLYAKPKGSQSGDGPILIRSTGQQGWAKDQANSVSDASYSDNW